MEFFHKDARLNINAEHYYPSFIARDVEELSQNANTRKALRQYKIFDDGQEDNDENLATSGAP